MANEIKIMNGLVDGLVQTYKIKLNERTQNALTRNKLILNELALNNSYVYNSITNNEQTQKVTALYILQHSQLGLTLNNDFWIVPFKDQVKPVVKGQVWVYLAKKYSIKKIKDISVKVVFKTDKATFRQENGKDLFDYEMDLNADRTNYDNINGAMGIIAFENGEVEYHWISKSTINNMKAKSTGANSDKGDKTPWKFFPEWNIESKLLRTIAVRWGELDRGKMMDEGLLFEISEEQPVEAEVDKIEPIKNTAKETGYLDRQKDNYKVEVKEVIKEEDISEQSISDIELQRVRNMQENDELGDLE